ncbi:shikimate kinase [Mesonia maritima]|uniref:Shikimate kinase n=1 Tax=Mesonia maritima TaxID=1793873 RepID=A0ABU1K4B1_9FLAO|nr:shikimate kinase [Mesonia maritima]MDR6300450.1 shikimate kinase [Mesonia maritima]
MKIVLCGYMGSGKSSVGKLLASELGLEFIELDQEIEKIEKRYISEIFSEKSEIYFRKKESEVLKNVLKEEKSMVISLGGGTPCYANNLEILQQNEEVTLIYLKVSVEKLTDRLFSEKATRPLIAEISSEEKLEEFIRKHLFERQFYYMQSDLILDTTTMKLTEIVAILKEKLM